MGLDLLSRDERFAREKVASGLWYLANMADLGYDRLIRDKPAATAREYNENASGKPARTPDLQVMDAPTFYENVRCAVEARRRFPWGGRLSEENFRQHVLPARARSEPLQRWRRHQRPEPGPVDHGGLRRGAE